MGNDLKYGLVLGAVVLLIFVGYYAIMHQSKKAEEKPVVTTRKIEPPKQVDIFAPSTTFAAPVDTSAVPPSTAVMVIGEQPPVTPSTLSPYGAPSSTLFTGVRSSTYGGYVPPGTFAAVRTPSGTGLGAPAVTFGARPQGVTGLGSQPPLRALDVPKPAAKTHKIAKGDTLAEISMKYYGTPNDWQKIVDANKDKKLNPTNLVIGTEIVIPDVPAEKATAERPGGAAPTAAAKTHTIQSGDTLSGLARKYYGDQTAWQKIYSANKDKISNPNALKVGTVITIP